MNRSIVLSRLMILCGMISLLCACSMVQEKRTPEQIIRGASISSVRVGISPDYPPLAFKQDGKIAGVEAEFAKQLGQELNFDVTFVEQPFDELLLALGTKQIDVIMSGMSVSKKRQEVAAFTRPYMQVGQVAIVRRADQDNFTPASEALYVNGLRVGYEVGTTGMGFVVNTMLLAQPVKFQSADAGLKALQAGDVAAFIHDQPTAWRMTSDAAFNDLVVLTDPLTQEDLAWAVHKDNRPLLDALNGTLDAWKKSGYLTSLLDRWMAPPPADP